MRLTPRVARRSNSGSALVLVSQPEAFFKWLHIKFISPSIDASTWHRALLRGHSVFSILHYPCFGLYQLGSRDMFTSKYRQMRNANEFIGAREGCLVTYLIPVTGNTHLIRFTGNTYQIHISFTGTTPHTITGNTSYHHWYHTSYHHW